MPFVFAAKLGGADDDVFLGEALLLSDDVKNATAEFLQESQ
jgi:hypothetical protein